MSTEKRYTAAQMLGAAECCDEDEDEFGEMLAAMLRQAASDAARIAELEVDAERLSKGWDQAVEALDASSEDAERWRTFRDAGLPITFLGITYTDMAELDAAIDAARSRT